ncbi:CGNR zinc finger domain-containing protein [Lysinibacillus sp. ZYM-1]|uniref:CGNR zinc finger domain-containing protein n=1 Tax=Lysinibacillus sp. ZYM-1 TaxID=1681184 RepID=UPI0006CE8471|nr:CGNR zinc finger domain-containing protein [Lysinibacillus sp. ZYM-1]KPN94918.1 RNA-binding protein [Lysinibacillus sp. ZYM-1]
MTETNKFPLISGHLSLDLVNTELVRRGQRQDLLLSEGDVLDWLYVINKENFFWDDKLYAKVKERIRQVLLCVLEIRAVLRGSFESIADGEPIQDEFINFLEKKIDKAPFTYKLINQKLTPIPVGEVEDVLLSLIAFDALTLIGENKLAFLKRCSNPDCVLLFIDEGGRRKWCSMKICGNRKKVARFQQSKSDE